MPRPIGIAHPRSAPNITVAIPSFPSHFAKHLQGDRPQNRPQALCHEYLAPDRTTFSGLSSFYTVLWHISLKAIRKNSEFLTYLKHATPGQPKLSFSKSPCPVNPHPHRTNSYHCRFVQRYKRFTGQTHIVAGFVRRYKRFT